MVERSTSRYCVTMTKNTEKESRLINFIVWGGGGSGILYQNTIGYHIIIVYCKGYEQKNLKPTQSFPKPLKKLRQLGV